MDMRDMQVVDERVRHLAWEWVTPTKIYSQIQIEVESGEKQE